MPVGVKDVEDTAGLPTTYGSRRFLRHRPDADPPVAALRASGAIVLGRNTPAFALLGETRNELRDDPAARFRCELAGSGTPTP